MDNEADEKRVLQRRRIYLEDRMPDIMAEIEGFDAEAVKLKETLSQSPTGELLTRTQRRLNYVRQRLAMLNAERVDSNAERTAIIRQLREMSEGSS
jgi:hypothetical protein